MGAQGHGRITSLGALLRASAAPAAALLIALPPAAAAPTRAEVPIHQIRLPGGAIRYSIPIRVGNSAPIEAMLDTGSTGVRIFAGAAEPSEYSLTDRRLDNSWPFSVESWEGNIADAAITIGGIQTGSRIPIQVIVKITCAEDHPNCRGAQQDIQHYQMFGGFRAMIGASMPTHHPTNKLDNPLVSMTPAWVIEVPRPDDPEPGKLILNPSAEELASFTWFEGGLGPNVGGGRDNPVPGCVVNEQTKQSFCGPVVLDSGNPSITVITSDFPQTVRWTDGTPASLYLKTSSGGALAGHFTVAGMEPHTQVRLGAFPQFDQPAPRILAGIMPYLAFSVAYDYEHDKIGLKPRPTPMAQDTRSAQDGQGAPSVLPAGAALNISGRWQFNSAWGVPLCGLKQTGSSVAGSCIGSGAVGSVSGSVSGNTVTLRWEWSHYDGAETYVFDFTGTVVSPTAIKGTVRQGSSPPAPFEAHKQ